MSKGNYSILPFAKKQFMAHRKFRNRRKRAGSTSFTSRKRSRRSSGSIAPMFRSKVKRVLKSCLETKYKVDPSLHNFYVDRNGTIVEIAKPTQGIQDDQRVGDTIENLSLTIVGHVVGSDVKSVAAFPAAVRFLVIQSHNNNIFGGTLPDFFVHQGAAVINSDIRWDSIAGNYKVLLDRRIGPLYPSHTELILSDSVPETVGGSLATNGNSIRYFKYRIKVPKKMVFIDTLTTNLKGRLFCFVISDAAGSSALRPIITYNMSLTYKDC